MRINVFFFVNAKVRTFAAEVQPHGYSGIRLSYKLQVTFGVTSTTCLKVCRIVRYIILLYIIILYIIII